MSLIDIPPPQQLAQQLTPQPSVLKFDSFWFEPLRFDQIIPNKKPSVQELQKTILEFFLGIRSVVLFGRVILAALNWLGEPQIEQKPTIRMKHS